MSEETPKTKSTEQVEFKVSQQLFDQLSAWQKKQEAEAMNDNDDSNLSELDQNQASPLMPPSIGEK